MQKLMLILIALIAAVTFVRSLDAPLNAEENPASLLASPSELMVPIP